jgi:hypothetical protein
MQYQTRTIAHREFLNQEYHRARWMSLTIVNSTMSEIYGNQENLAAKECGRNLRELF